MFSREGGVVYMPGGIADFDLPGFHGRQLPQMADCTQ
jgi:hypothetical protein